MPIAGEFPETGFRVDLERLLDGPAPWTYEGCVASPTARYALTVTVSDNGQVVVASSGDMPGELGERVRLLVRTAWKHAHAEGRAPPRRLLRWRADR